MTRPIPDEFEPSEVGGHVSDVRFVRDARARVATVATLRSNATLPERSGGTVHLECHTQAGLGGGSLTWGAYGADDNGTCFRVAGRTDGAWRRPDDIEITPHLWGGAGDYLPGQTDGVWDESKDAGGLSDNAAIVAALAHCKAKRVSLRLPDGYWLIDSIQLVIGDNAVIEGNGQNTALIFTKIDAPIQIKNPTSTTYPDGYQVRGASLTGFSIITYNTDFTRAVLLTGAARLKLDLGFVGPFVWCVDSPMATSALPTHTSYGHQYFPDILIRTPHRDGSEPYPAPSRGPINGFRNELRNEPGGLTGGIVRVHAHSASFSGYGVYVIRGISITIDAVTEGAVNCGVHVSDAVDVHIVGGYAEGNTASVELVDCQIVEITKQNSAPIQLTRCSGVSLGGQACSVNFVDCLAPVVLGAVYNNGTLGSAIASNNVGVVSFSANHTTGGERVRESNFSQVDSENLFIGGQLDRYVSGVPWNQYPDGSNWGTSVKCGPGLSDTTAPSGSAQSAHYTGWGVYYVRLTGPIGEQYANTYLAVQFKAKFASPTDDGSSMIVRVKGRGHSYAATSGIQAHWSSVGEYTALSGADAGWYLVSRMLPIDAAWCADGLDLQLQTPATTDMYVADFDVRFGVANQRCPARATRSFDGSATLTEGGKLRWSAAATSEVDPWAGQAVIDGDRIDLPTPVEATASGGVHYITTGWVRSAGVWKPLQCLTGLAP